MKNKLSIRSLVLLASITGSFNSQAATITKSATGTDLTDGASWGGTAPTAVDNATWTASSLGAGLTLGSSASWQGINVTAALTDIEITGAADLTLGSDGIDLASSSVNLSISNPIALSAAQSWKVATGRTLTTSGVISGPSGLTIGAAAQTATTTTFLTGTAQTLFTNASLANLTSTSGRMGGAFVNAGTPVNATGFTLSNNGSTASYWLQAIDGGFLKGVRIELTQSGADIAARATAAKFLSGGSLGFNFDTGGSGATLATVQTGNGYGAHTTTLQFGNDSTGTIVMSGANNYTGSTTITRGTLRAGVASVAGVSGAFGVDSAVSLANAASTSINLDGFNTNVGSLTGGGTTGGGITLGSATLTTGGDNSSPAAYAGVISGTGGVAKIGSGTQILSATNTYNGGTIVSGTGTLTGSTGVAFNGTQGGSFGPGSITVETGATIRSAGVFVIGGGQNTTRTLNLNGGTANITGAGTGGEYIKTINLTGGTLNADNGTVYFRAPNGGTALNSLAASTSSTISTRVDLTLGNLAASVADGAAAQDLVLSGAITENSGAGSGARSLTKTGDGTLVLSGTSSYSGVTAVNAGTLTVTGTLSAAAGSVDVAANATLSGTGTIDRTVNLALDSNLQPAGSSIGTLTVGGTANLLGKSILQIDKDATPTLTQDLLDATTINYGGTLEVTATGEAIALGDSFKLFDATTYSGGFTNFTLPSLPVGLSWDLANLTMDGTIKVVDFVGTPVFSPGTGSFEGTPSVTITSDSGSTIYYTVDGSTPTAASATYSSPIALPANTVGFTLKAFAQKAGQADSPVATAVYNTLNTPTWINNGNGFWGSLAGDELNWQNTVVAGGIGSAADFSTIALTQNTVVTLDGSRSIGSMTFGDASAVPASDWSLVPSNNSTLSLATISGTPTITVNNQTTTISTVLSGSQGLAKSGAGTLNLNVASSYTGDTTVTAGSLILNSSTIASQAAQLASPTINNSATVTFYRGATGFTPVNASLSGAGDFVVDGPGGGGLYDNRLAFRGAASDNTGTVRIINNGRLWVDFAGTNAIGDSAILEVGTSGSFYVYQGISETIGALAGSGNVFGGDAAGTSALTVGGGDRSADFSGVLQNQSSTLRLTKIGTGTQTLSGLNTYTGDTVINAGTLELAATGRLRFRITNTSNNTLSGAGTATLDGEFAIDTAAVTTGTGPWLIENVSTLTGAYGSTFKVVNPDGSPWTDADSDKWTKPATAGKVWIFNEATGSLSLEMAGYDSWLAEFTFPVGADTTRTGDPDGDGFSNLQEFLFGSSPVAGNGSLSTITTVPGGNLVILWSQRTSGTSYQLKESATLGNDWVNATGATIETDGAAVGNYQPMKATVTPGAGSKFFRVEGSEN
jgi:autotransporter-associated beta strand protein